ncbi:MAG: hypothetical protein WBF58_11860 [Xanthobacteraceae bacterium]
MTDVLIEILAAVIGGMPIGTVLAGLTDVQWVTLAAGVAEEVAPSIAEKLGLAHPSLEVLVAAVGKGVSDELAAKAARDWFAANAAAAMREQPGMGEH